MKRFLSFLICISLLLSVLPINYFMVEASAAIVKSGSCGENVNYTIDENGVLTISGSGAMANRSYSENSLFLGAKTAVIQKGVTSIGDYAFKYCNGLTNVTISNSITSIGIHAFEGCGGLTSVIIPEGVTSIGAYAFDGCGGLQSVTIPEGVISIGDDAFRSCSKLTSVIIPTSVTKMGYDVFKWCYELEKIEVNRGNKKYHSSNNCLIETYTKKLIRGCNHSIIPDDGSVVTIESEAFEGYSGLTSVTIPNGITWIGHSAFERCSGLTNVIIPDSVTAIGESAFFDCSSLTSVTIPESVTSIGDYAFLGCKSIESVTIPKSVKTIGLNTFKLCSGLEKIMVSSENQIYHSTNNCLIKTEQKLLISACKNSVIPDDESVVAINSGAFAGCSGLTSLTIPRSVTSIWSNAFDGCSGLKKIVVSNGNEKYHSSDNCLIETDTKTLIRGCENSIIPDDGSVIKLGETAFSDCSGLTSLIIPISVTSISRDTFDGCVNLRDIYYSGTKTQWNSISGISNNSFRNATIHYESSGPVAEYEVRIGYCTKSSVDIIVIDGVEYTPDPRINKLVFSGRYVKYTVDTQNCANVLSFISPATGTFDDLDYLNKKITISGVTYNITEECLNSDAFKSFNASLYTRFGQTILFFRDYDSNIRTVYAISYDGYLVGILTNIIVENGQKKEAVIDNVKYRCADDCIITEGVKASSDGQMVSCEQKDGKITRILLYVKQNYGVYKEDNKNTDSSSGSGYITDPSRKNRIISLYLDDIYEAADGVLRAVKDGIARKLKIKNIDDVVNSVSPEKLAQQMKEDDKAKRSANIVLDNLKPQHKKAQDAAYKALASIYVDYIYGNVLDFSNVNVKSDSITFYMNMMKSIINGSKGTGTYNNVQVDGYTFNFNIWAEGGKYAGTIGVYKSGKFICNGLVSSDPDSVKKVLDQYSKDLQKIVKDAVNYAEFSFVTEFCDVVGIKELTKEQVKSRFDSIIKSLSPKEKDRLKKTLTQNTVDAVAEIAETLGLFQQGKNTFNKSSPVMPDSIIKLVERAEKLSYTYDDLLDDTTKKAVEKLDNYIEQLLKAFNDYKTSKLGPYTKLEDEKNDTSSGKKRAIIQCPVDVEIYDKNGKLAGYVDSNENRGKYIWSNQDINISVSGGVKTVVFPADKEYTIKMIAYADGKMNYTIEHQYPDGSAERLNYYDVSLTEGESYEQIVTDNLSLAEHKDDLALKKETTMINADDYYSSDDDAAVKILVNTADGGNAYSDIFYVKGSPVTLRAFPNEGYGFDGWYFGKTLLSKDAVYRFTAREDMNLLARFEPLMYYKEMCVSVSDNYLDAIYAENGVDQVGNTILKVYDENNALNGKKLIAYGIKEQSLTEELLKVVPDFDSDNCYTFLGIDNTYRTIIIREQVGKSVITLQSEHQYGNWTTVLSSTVTTEGSEERSCTFCGVSETRVIPKLEQQPVQSEYTLGDVNCDGDVLANDARLALRASAHLETLDELQTKVADVDCDGQVLAKDARQILRFSAKLQSEFEKA